MSPLWWQLQRSSSSPQKETVWCNCQRHCRKSQQAHLAAAPKVHIWEYKKVHSWFNSETKRYIHTYTHLCRKNKQKLKQRENGNGNEKIHPNKIRNEMSALCTLINDQMSIIRDIVKQTNASALTTRHFQPLNTYRYSKSLICTNVYTYVYISMYMHT